MQWKRVRVDVDDCACGACMRTLCPASCALRYPPQRSNCFLAPQARTRGLWLLLRETALLVQHSPRPMPVRPASQSRAAAIARMMLAQVSCAPSARVAAGQGQSVVQCQVNAQAAVRGQCQVVERPIYVLLGTRAAARRLRCGPATKQCRVRAKPLSGAHLNAAATLSLRHRRPAPHQKRWQS